MARPRLVVFVVRPGQKAVVEVIYYNNITHIMYLCCLRPTAHVGDKIIIIIISSYYYYKTSCALVIAAVPIRCTT